jgi:putative phosphonate catabolism associated alcohol dehydrogenase
MQTSADPGLARAALFQGAGQPFAVIESPVPVPAAGEVLVDVECCAVCASDLHTHAGRRSEPTPTVLGHEAVGTVRAIGPGAPMVAHGGTLSIGDRVTWTITASCGHCGPCGDGLPQKCARLTKYGHAKVAIDMPFRGGLADVMLLAPGTTLVRIPPGVPAPIATLANCAIATVGAVLRVGFDRRRGRPGGALAVLGTGVLGLVACAMARSVWGASVVIACDRDATRAGRAAAFGATHICPDLDALPDLVRSATDGGVDVAVELAGTLDTARSAIAAARTGGTVVLAGTTSPTDPLSIEPQAIVRRLLRVEGVHSYGPADLVSAVDFLRSAARSYPLSSLLADQFGLNDVDNAFARGHQLPGRRVLVIPALDRGTGRDRREIITDG